jgi:hypothetical protein
MLARAALFTLIPIQSTQTHQTVPLQGTVLTRAALFTLIPIQSTQTPQTATSRIIMPGATEVLCSFQICQLTQILLIAILEATQPKMEVSYTLASRQVI